MTNIINIFINVNAQAGRKTTSATTTDREQKKNRLRLFNRFYLIFHSVIKCYVPISCVCMCVLTDRGKRSYTMREDTLFAKI